MKSSARFTLSLLVAFAACAGTLSWPAPQAKSAEASFPSRPANVDLVRCELVAGGIVRGTEPDPLADFQGLAVYHDDVQDYSSNEPTMDGTASAILMWTLCSEAQGA
jgi:hypothetical protein